MATALLTCAQAPGLVAATRARPCLPFRGHSIVPGFIDVHVHGVGGVDSLDAHDTNGRSAVSVVASRLPRYGVTAFCPTTVACPPDVLGRVLESVATARRRGPEPGAARVLPAISKATSSTPISAALSLRAVFAVRDRPWLLVGQQSDGFQAAELLAEIGRAGADVGIVTVAPELDGGLDLMRWLAARGSGCRLGTPVRPTSRRSRPSTPERDRPRISSIGCRRLRIAPRASPALSCRATRSRPRSSVTGSTSIPRWCGRRSRPRVPRASWPSLTGRHCPGLPLVPGHARWTAHHGRRVGGRALETGRSPAACARWTACFGCSWDQVGCLSSRPQRCAQRPRRASWAWTIWASSRPAPSPTSWCLDGRLSVVQTYVAGQLVYRRNEV